ncbi:MAG: preprotein translocase subunit SecE [Bacteriovoracales bacterium]|nr:preprotein translocase subunit SecE [Bacteriovoracales bacterium]
MPALRETDGKKWINALVAIASLILANILIKLLYQISEWTDLEAKVENFRLVAQVIGIFVGVLTFVIVLRSTRAYGYLREVYGELTKVIWPDKDSTLKLTAVIVVGVAIIAVFFGLIDFGIKEFLELLY